MNGFIDGGGMLRWEILAGAEVIVADEKRSRSEVLKYSREYCFAWSEIDIGYI